MQSSTETPPLTDLQHRDNLCGPFHAARVLREVGITEWDGDPIDQDLVAVHPGSALPEIERGPQGRRGALVVVRDSYPSLGWAGVHLQPPGAVAAALTRGDGRGGGVLAVGSPDGAAEVEQLASRLGLEIKMWDNSR